MHFCYLTCSLFLHIHTGETNIIDYFNFTKLARIPPLKKKKRERETESRV